jgi:hypothetical protein
MVEDIGQRDGSHWDCYLIEVIYGGADNAKVKIVICGGKTKVKITEKRMYGWQSC